MPRQHADLEDQERGEDWAYNSDVDTLTLWSNLTTVRTNPLNNKCLTLPILRLDNQYSVNFHLSWLGFWVAFLSWFAFSPLIPEAVRTDLQLTQEEIGNSNIVSLCATLGVRLVVGPLVDRFGPRKVMAGILLVGAIPSGLTGTISSAQGLYVIRFFIGILGGTFVPCQAWTTAFFDTRVVGRANALVGGWGNSGGGFTFIIMVGLYDRLRRDGLSIHSAWRSAFAIAPVPILITVAIVTLVFGTDHPDGALQDRNGPQHAIPSDVRTIEGGALAMRSARDGKKSDKKRSHDSHAELPDEPEKSVTVDVRDVVAPETYVDTYSDLAREGPGFNWPVFSQVIANPLTWLPAFAYLTSFGYELAIDANLSNVIFGLYNPTKHSLNQTTSGYIASIYGLLNLCSRPAGGYLGDVVYRKYGVLGKKYLVLLTGVVQGLLSIGIGVYIDHNVSGAMTPPLPTTIALIVLVALFNEMANGANFSLVPHCNPDSNGFMTGIVGAMGNLGGIWFALVWRYQPHPFGRAFWIAGVISMVVNMMLVAVRVPGR